MKTNMHFNNISLNYCYKENVSTKSSRETQNRSFVFIIFIFIFFRKSYRLWDNVERCCRAGQAKEDDMSHAHCMLDT